jgi:3-oxoacyl-[acyl-carrier-protein] synthase-3
LVDTTIASLNADHSLTRESIKSTFASLTIGSASAAVLLAHDSISRTGNRLLATTARANTEQNHLCRGGRDEAVAGGMQPLMQTDSETLLHEGVAIGQETFAEFLNELGWSPEGVGKTACHQVGTAHRKLLLEALKVDLDRDFVTYPRLGNTGAAAVPVTLAIGSEEGHYMPGDRVTLLGIGSGINVLMLALDWQKLLVSGGVYRR